MEGLIFLYLAIFPFGKLVGNISDAIVLFLSVIFIFKIRKLKIDNFIVVCLFSILFSLSFFNLPDIFTGILYLVRFISYVILSRIVYQQFAKEKKKKILIFNSLVVVGVFIAIFGWIQYFILPDLRFLKSIGWDDHYLRLVSTFLDPAFTGIILVLTEILVLIKTIQNKVKFNFLLNIFLIITILFTYSRSSFIALTVVLIYLFLKFKDKFIFLLLGLFLILIPLLPKENSEGTNLARTYSINQKIVNYDQSLKLIQKSPIFGIGFDNLCIAKQKFLDEQNTQSHTCSGLDNSILFIVATTGITGLIVFIDAVLRIVKNTKKDRTGTTLFASLVAVFIHGMFTNTFFYSFVMGWIAILIGITREVKD